MPSAKKKAAAKAAKLRRAAVAKQIAEFAAARDTTTTTTTPTSPSPSSPSPVSPPSSLSDVTVPIALQVAFENRAEELERRTVGYTTKRSRPAQPTTVNGTPQPNHPHHHNTVADEEDEDGTDDDRTVGGSLPFHQLKRVRGLNNVADLKRVVRYPRLVAPEDVSARDPGVLIYTKSIPFSVPVPEHWSSKKKYLSGLTGIEKPPFVLPPFIQATGIAQLRGAQLEAEEAKSSAQLGRERTRPKMGRLDLDYDELHDAFFKHSTRPRNLTRLGDIFHEGKVLSDQRVLEYVPGAPLSRELRVALGMPPTGVVPPPWLRIMQNIGPPPDFPYVEYPGVNAPLPPGASYGPGAKQWGRAPVDAAGVPLFGDVFGVARDAAARPATRAAQVGAATPGPEDEPPLFGQLATDDDLDDMSDDSEDSNGDDDGHEKERGNVQPATSAEGDNAAAAAAFAPTAASRVTQQPASTTNDPQVERVSLEQLSAGAAQQQQKQLYTVLPGL